MATTNLTVRVDENIKRGFDTICENVGLTATSAVNMFIKTVVRTRTLPFTVTGLSAEEQNNKIIMARMKNAVQSMREQSLTSGNEDISLDDVNAEIAAYRRERRSENA
ncbi:MAG: type II toxin-antitoxin system RelB/DinJ family antitoxin [Firmicutes bacterium]|nr:type II toxin-antitoxin system RelB/DinJ family antitoxin [Bacillota bacterium]